MNWLHEQDAVGPEHFFRLLRCTYARIHTHTSVHLNPNPNQEPESQLKSCADSARETFPLPPDFDSLTHTFIHQPFLTLIHPRPLTLLICSSPCRLDCHPTLRYIGKTKTQTKKRTVITTRTQQRTDCTLGLSVAKKKRVLFPK